MSILEVNYSNINYDEMAVSIGLKPKHIPLILSSFISETTTLLNVLKEHVNTMDSDKIRACAHAIKGSAGNLKFNEIYEIAKEMEAACLEERNDFKYEVYIEAIERAIKTIST